MLYGHSATANVLENPTLDLRQDLILVVDDDPLMRESLSECLCSSGFACESAGSGREALEKLYSRPFTLAITDIRMPDLDGLSLLDKLTENYPDLAVIMLTGVADLGTAIETMKNGACDYITKPFDMEGVIERVGRALRLRSRRLRDKQIASRLEALVRKKSFALNSALRDLKQHRGMTLQVLVKALDARENETQCHSQRVQGYAIRLARQFGFPNGSMADLARGALLHDIGKIGVSDTILLKPGKLTQEEWAEMHRHPLIGYKILRGFKLLRRAGQMVLCHHERYDGLGYPCELKGQEIPLPARIFSVVDAYDAMVSRRPYRAATTPKLAREEIIANAGSQFDPLVVQGFLEVPQRDWNQIAERFS